MNCTTRLLACLALAVAPIASAQGLTYALNGSTSLRSVAEQDSHFSRSKPGARERAHGDQVAEALGAAANTVQRVDQLFHPEGKPAERPARLLRTKGFRIDLGNGNTVEHLRFLNERSAQAYVFQSARIGTGSEPGSVELRGRYAVLVRGPRAAEPDYARRALEAGWANFLGSNVPRDVRALFFNRGALIETQVPNAGFDTQFAMAVKATTDLRPERADVQVEGKRVSVALAGGFRAELHALHNGGRKTLTAKTPEFEAELRALAGRLPTMSTTPPVSAARAPQRGLGVLLQDR